MSVFDGMADIFVATFGDEDAAVYTPVDTGGPFELTAIFIQEPVVFGLEPSADGVRLTAHIKAEDVEEPREGDLITRTKTGETFKIVPPIAPDDKGMIACALEATA